MKTRLITAAVGIPFLIFTLIVRGWFAEFVIVVLTFIAMYENYRALKKAGYYVCEWGGYAAAAAMWPLSRQMGVLDPLLLVVAAMGVSMTGVMLREKPTFPDAQPHSVYPALYMLPADVHVHDDDEQHIRRRAGRCPDYDGVCNRVWRGRRGVFRRSCVRQAQALPERQPEKDGRRRNFRA